MNSGKSTLVNALVGSQVAETSGGEHTYVNWWFRRGSPERLRLRRPGGVIKEVEIGSALGELDPDHPAPVEVVLCSDLLEKMTLIDTPGLYSLSREKSEKTERLLRQGIDQSLRGASAADAILYVTSELPGAQEQSTLSRFTSTFGEAVRVAPTNALMLLSRAERRADRGPGKDRRSPLEQVAVLAQRYREDLYSCVWDIAPVSAHAAVLARTGQINDEVAAEVRALAEQTRNGAGEQASVRIRRWMLARDKYLHEELAKHGLRRLGALCDEGLGCYEADVMLKAADRNEATQHELRRALEVASGLKHVEDLITHTFAERGGLIQADMTLSEIEKLSFRLRDALPPGAAAHLRARCEAIRLASPQLQDLADARVVVNPAVPFSPEERSELAELFGAGGGRFAAADAALRATYWWTRVNAVKTSPEQQAIALRAHQHYARMATRREES